MTLRPAGNEITQQARNSAASRTSTAQVVQKDQNRIESAQGEPKERFIGSDRAQMLEDIERNYPGTVQFDALGIQDAPATEEPAQHFVSPDRDQMLDELDPNLQVEGQIVLATTRGDVPVSMTVIEHTSQTHEAGHAGHGNHNGKDAELGLLGGHLGLEGGEMAAHNVAHGGTHVATEIAGHASSHAVAELGTHAAELQAEAISEVATDAAHVVLDSTTTSPAPQAPAAEGAAAKGHVVNHAAEGVAAKGHGVNHAAEAVTAKGHGAHHAAEGVAAKAGHAHGVTDLAADGVHLSTAAAGAIIAGAVGSLAVGTAMTYLGARHLKHGIQEKDTEAIMEGSGAIIVGARSGLAAASLAGLVTESAVIHAIAEVGHVLLPPLGVAHGTIDAGLGFKDLYEGALKPLSKGEQIDKSETIRGALGVGLGVALIATALGAGVPALVTAMVFLGGKIGHRVYEVRQARKTEPGTQELELVEVEPPAAEAQVEVKSSGQSTEADR